MAHPKHVTVKESVKKLKQLQKTVKPLFVPRLQMLLIIKQSDVALSKQALSKLVGANHNSIQKWRGMYLKGGIDALLQHKTTASAPFMLNAHEREMVYRKLSDPKGGVRGYKELWVWAEREFGRKIKYNSLMVFCRNHLGTKIKVARKSHVKKDQKSVEAFKKTLIVTAKRP